MCGIAGFIGRGTRETVKKMADTLQHRGPDEEGFFIDDADSVYMGFRRLAIIDLSSGSQPMGNEDGSVTVAFNGEIYNFRQLREDLEKRHTFKTQSDTEVIVHLYEEKGERCFEYFNGMFAIAIWDKKKKRLLLARDRMGKKPLYWARIGNTFLFGSELKALLAHPVCRRTLSRQAVLKYFFFLCVPSPWTIYEGVFKLEPGQRLLFEKGHVTTEAYWRPDYKTDASCTVPEALEELDRLLEDATRLRLVSDVPLGVFLSGGIDSSLVTYYASRAAGTRVKTFSIGFNVPGFDESLHAQCVSDALGTEHHLKIFEPQTLLDVLPNVARFMDEPFADSSILPTYLLSMFTREQVTVALGGDGGDELFLGYPTYQAHRLAEWYRFLPRAFQYKLIPALVHLLPVQHAGLSLDYKLKTFVFGAPYAVGIRQQAWISTFHPDIAKGLFTREFLKDLPENTAHVDVDTKLAELSLRGVDEAAMYLYERYFLADDVLTKVDRASMAASLEVRAPFLDVRIVEFAHRLPVALRMRFFRNKYLLKRLLRGKVPDTVIDRPKKGFWAPIGPWLRKELAPFMHDLLSRQTIESEGVFCYPYIRQLMQEHQAGVRDHRKLLWSLCMFQLWRKTWHSA